MATAKAEKNEMKEKIKRIFTTKNITRMAVFTVLAYLLYMPIFEFSLIPAVPFLKIDFSNAFVMIAGFALGPIPAITVGILKELLHAVTFSQTVGVGELANIIIMLPYVLIPSIFYRKHRTIKTVFITLAAACVVQSAWSVPVNYLLTFPFFLMAYAGASSWSAGMEFYLTVWYWAVLFNFVKTLLVSAAVLLLYKQFQRLFALIFRENKNVSRQTVSDTDNGGSNAIAHSGRTVYTARSPEETAAIGERIGKSCVGGEIILLSGDLGAGKTVFCKGLAKGLGIDSEIVSPTFTILNEYPNGRLEFLHIDAYRLSSADEAEGAGITERLGDKTCVFAVEWWENIVGSFDGENTVKVKIEKLGDAERSIAVEK